MADKEELLQAEEYDSLMLDVVDNLDRFIESINCIKETYEFSEVTLRAHLNETTGKYNNFVKSYERKDVDGYTVIEVPDARYREFERLHKKKARAERAFDLVPPSYFVSLVSAYDSFFGGLIRCLYSISPEKLQEEDMHFCYRDLQQFDNITDVKKRIIDKRVETELRDSHVAQIDWLAKALKIDSLTSTFIGWSDFVEVTERRNLFVHANGTVSAQYIDNCKKHKALDASILEGNQLKVDKTYFDKAFKILYKTAIMLTQTLLRKKYCKNDDPDCISHINKVLIGNVFELISDKHYDVAIDVSQMVLSNPKFKFNAFDKMYIVLNYAQAYKWSGNPVKCKEILDQEDWTAYTNELLIPKFTLEENYPEVYKRMRELGKNNQRITISSYREWPIFQLLRGQKEFETVFAEIFGEDFDSVKTVELEKAFEKTVAATTAKISEYLQASVKLKELQEKITDMLVEPIEGDSEPESDDSSDGSVEK